MRISLLKPASSGILGLEMITFVEPLGLECVAGDAVRFNLYPDYVIDELVVGDLIRVVADVPDGASDTLTVAIDGHPAADLIGLGEYLVQVQIAADNGAAAAPGSVGDDFGDAYGSHQVPKTVVVGPLRPGVRGGHNPILTGASA